MMSGIGFMKGAAFVVVAASTWMIADASPVSAQTSGADTVKTFDTDNDGTVDLTECKIAGAATFDKLDAQTASPYLAFGDSGVIWPLKPPARDRGVGAVGRATVVTRGNCVLSSGASLSSLETVKST